MQNILKLAFVGAFVLEFAWAFQCMRDYKQSKVFINNGKLPNIKYSWKKRLLSEHFYKTNYFISIKTK